MDLNDYQLAARLTAVYPSDEFPLVYPALGLAGEAGEAVEKVKKAVRKGGKDYFEYLDHHGLVRELGDVLWYVANMASDMGVDLEEIAQINIDKLKDRMNRDVIKGEGDHR
jgi:NTP pyrophosphatase (non-canonical NTP hydrolase)